MQTATLNPLDASFNKPTYLESRLLHLLGHIKKGSLRVQIGERKTPYLVGEAPPQADIHIVKPKKFAKALLLWGDLGFAEAYMQGDWTTSNLSGLMLLLANNQTALQKVMQPALPLRVLKKLGHKLNRNSLLGSRRNIAAHYDLGNDFYAQWLDASMSYSAAIFDQTDDLQAAQDKKYAYIMHLLDAQPGSHILEIGCGWGGFAEHAARWGMHVDGVTLSKEQLAYAQQRMQDAGVQTRVDLRLQDYRKLSGQYDHIVSIEMFEAVGQEYWQQYFAKLAQSLKSQGRAVLQVITLDDALFEGYQKNAGGFIQKYIFPGGMLPTEKHLCDLAKAEGLAPIAVQRYGGHYADTLALWHARFNAQEAWMQAHGYDLRFRRMWRYYLAFCEAGFKQGSIDVVHLTLQKF